MARVVRSERAQQDLEEIFDYFDGRSSQAAERFALKLEQSCRVHADHPLIGSACEEYAPNLRHFTVWNHAVFYRPIDGGIELIRIIHGARDIPKLFD